jgi:hypothetical protein
MNFSTLKSAFGSLKKDAFFLAGLTLFCGSGGMLWKGPVSESSQPKERNVPVAAAAIPASSFGAPSAAETLTDGHRRWVVDNSGLTEGAVPRIMQAVLAAGPGDVVDVKSGTYAENLILSKPITIRGTAWPDGKPSVTIVSANAHTVLVDTSGGAVILENLSIGQSQQPQNGEKHFTGISLSSGELTGKNLSVLSARTEAVLVGGGKLALNDSQFNGIIGLEQYAGEVVCTNCVSNQNRDAAIALMNGPDGKTNPVTITLRHFESKDNYGAGIYGMGAARVTLEDSEIAICGNNGVQVDENVQAVIRNTRIANCKLNGVQVTANGVVSLENTQVTANGVMGVITGGAGRATIKNSQLLGNGQYGYAYMASSVITVDGTTITGNAIGDFVKLTPEMLAKPAPQTAASAAVSAAAGRAPANAADAKAATEIARAVMEAAKKAAAQATKK